MVVKILQPSSTFQAVDYNERKVPKGVARLLELKNFSYLEDAGITNACALRRYLMDYSAMNERIRNTQFHVTFSCREHEYSYDKLVEIAHMYLNEMGYGMEGQPLLIYGHHDTENNHIHVITSRVDPKGNKINDSFEKIKSQNIMDKIMRIDRNVMREEAVKNALAYNFENISQFKAVLESSGYECYEKDDELCIKRGGVVQGTLKIADIEAHKKTGYMDVGRKRQLKAILEKYRDMSSSKTELRDIMKEKFGVDLVFVGSKDKPYGYMIVDHKNKAVYKGSAVLSLRSLLVFRDKQERLQSMDMFIDGMLEDNNRLTTRELNRMLRRQFAAYISKGKIVCGKDRIQLADYIVNALKRNDKCEWLQSFNPATEEEREILCKMGKIKDQKLLNLTPGHSKNVDDSINKIKEVLENGQPSRTFSDLREAGIFLMKGKENYYCVDTSAKQVFKLADYDIRVSRSANVLNEAAAKNRTAARVAKTGGKGAASVLNSGGAADSNREWEVGSRRRRNDDDIDDERTLRR